LASTVFQRVVAIDPDFPFVDTHLGRALTFCRQTDGGVTLLAGLDGRHLGRFKHPLAQRAFLAQAYVMTGQRVEAESLAAAHGDSAAAWRLFMPP
jgi:hypothetical protein